MERPALRCQTVRVPASDLFQQGADPTLHTGRIPSGVQEALERLPPREKFVLERKFGIGVEPETLDQIGRQLNLSRERIRQIKLEALAKLKKAPELRDLYDALAQVETAELN
jgi:DNA-directed RNA polymerase sigma subunit (sigma70/sigma32)